ncbi:MAG: hypothetical protein EBZ49_04650 [Proteobacteria bacterium]|nr:hypothetical protein [Pseudomonadota bacterium]
MVSPPVELYFFADLLQLGLDMKIKPIREAFILPKKSRESFDVFNLRSDKACFFKKTYSALSPNIFYRIHFNGDAQVFAHIPVHSKKLSKDLQ